MSLIFTSALLKRKSKNTPHMKFADAKFCQQYHQLNSSFLLQRAKLETCKYIFVVNSQMSAANVSAILKEKINPKEGEEDGCLQYFGF